MAEAQESVAKASEEAGGDAGSALTQAEEDIERGREHVQEDWGQSD